MYTLYLKLRRKVVVIWTIALSFFMLASMQKFSAFEVDTESTRQMFDAIPNILKIVYGMADVDVTTLDGYFSVMILYFYIIIGVYAGILGAKLIQEEVDENTSEFLFVKPISRKTILIKKYLAAFTIILFLIIIVYGSSYIYIKTQFNDVVTNFNQFIIAQLIISIFLLSFGTFLSTLKTSKYAVTIIIVVTLLFFTTRAFAQIKGYNLSFISPFSAFEPSDILNNGINIVYSIYYISISILFIILSFIQIKKKEFMV